MHKPQNEGMCAYETHVIPTVLSLLLKLFKSVIGCKSQGNKFHSLIEVGKKE